MNATILRGDWNLLKGKAKQSYARLVRNDAMYVEGREDELLGRLQKRAGVVWEEVLSGFSARPVSDGPRGNIKRKQNLC
jgi:uncharacterized protein YjbJ (UPF0337 family)